MSADPTESWNRYVEASSADVRALRAALEGDAGESTAGKSSAAQAAFRVGLASLLVGADDVGKLALALERALDASPDERTASVIARSIAALEAAFDQLAHADKSGARVEGLPLGALVVELEGQSPEATAPRPRSVTGVPATRPTESTSTPSAPSAAAAAPSPTAGPFTWAPRVDEDMIDLFFEEAAERIENISSKLIALEQRGGDRELLGDLFRDLHTVKGSSAMVGLDPVQRLAHAAEDLVGALRDDNRAVDASAVNALLSTLDALRAMLDEARRGRTISLDPQAVVRALRDPSSAAPIPLPATATAPRPIMDGHEEAAHPGAPRAAARPTIRVDFDKLDRLLNLVGELVLGRDGLKTASSALSSVSTELSADRAVAKRLSRMRARPDPKKTVGPSSRHAAAERAAMQELTEELGRVERVLSSITSDLEGSSGQIDSISSELRDQVMRLRMIPVGGVFRKHQRTVRDLCQSLGKAARLELAGEDTELDKVLVESLDEPLMHLVRNAVDHGLEGPAARAASGKPAEGVVRIEALHRGNQIVITVADDGRGMDPAALKRKAREKELATPEELEAMDERAVLELVFRPGFSTAATVSEVSGRGVGMDVVRQTIVTRLKGTIDIDSVLGGGTTFTLKLPLTLAIIQVLIARVAGETFAIPLDAVQRTLAVAPSQIAFVGDREVLDVEGRHIPLVRLAHVLELDDHEPDENEDLFVVCTEHGKEIYGLVCERLVGKKEIVIKSLGELLSNVPCAAGATLLGDRCALILDIPALIQRALKRPTRPARGPKAPKIARAHVLLVDDSDTIRESLRRLLVDAGYTVTTAEDGRAALELCQKQRFDLVSTDVMMPHVDGYELTRALRAMPDFRDVPIVMVTSRGERIDRVRGFDAGVDEYITKPHDRQLLLGAVEKLLEGTRPGS